MGAHEEDSRLGQDMQKLGESHQGGVLEKKRTVREDLRAFYSMKEELYELEEGALPTWAHADPRHAEETGSGHMGWH